MFWEVINWLIDSDEMCLQDCEVGVSEVWWRRIRREQEVNDGQILVSYVDTDVEMLKLGW